MMHTIMRYNYTDTFRSTLELATDKARELGLPEVSLDLLLWGDPEGGNELGYQVPLRSGALSPDAPTAHRGSAASPQGGG